MASLQGRHALVTGGGRGIGRALTNDALTWARRHGCTSMLVNTHVANEAALALYRKFDFRVEGTCKAVSFRDGKYTDTFLMARFRPGFYPADERHGF